MKVSALIAALAEIDPDIPVCIGEDHGVFDLGSVTQDTDWVGRPIVVLREGLSKEDYDRWVQGHEGLTDPPTTRPSDAPRMTPGT